MCPATNLFAAYAANWGFSVDDVAVVAGGGPDAKPEKAAILSNYF